MATATFNGKVIAQSDDTTFVEGNHYFPIDSLDQNAVAETAHHTVCPWKGTASYFSIEVDGQTADNAAWFYPEAKVGAEQVVGRVAFYPAVTVEA
jgi:uncharacterized protein (DUF427 family)